MIRLNNNSANAMEFTSFKKKENVSDDELLNALSNFETTLSKHPGLIFHCLLRNYSNEYAHLLLASSMNNFKNLESNLGHFPEVKFFFELIDMQTVKIEYHEIQKENFQVPTNFSCVEKGIFSLKEVNNFDKLLQISDTIEKEYLNTFENTKAHFIGTINTNRYSEITFGETLGKTKQICMGYFENTFCKKLLEISDETSMELDFWYVIA
ncbi:MAG: hypothetical protein LBE36_06905 [Flavobacteriaceae bacterium]|jgi:hypothetical protein|nr:hypothetical protein [Flavobacteriaceae bacterium]